MRSASDILLLFLLRHLVLERHHRSSESHGSDSHGWSDELHASGWEDLFIPLGESCRLHDVGESQSDACSYCPTKSRKADVLQHLLERLILLLLSDLVELIEEPHEGGRRQRRCRRSLLHRGSGGW